MLRWQDVHFQLVDLPAIDAEHPVPWLTSTLQSADACLLVVDLADPDCLQQVTAVQQELARRKISLVTRWPADAAGQAADADAAAPATDEDVFALRLPTLLLANKADLLDHADTDLEVLAELEEPHFPGLLVSAQTGAGLGELGEWLWRAARAGAGLHQGAGQAAPSATGRSRCAPASRPWRMRRGSCIATWRARSSTRASGAVR